jgi:hypothetical protein
LLKKYTDYSIPRPELFLDEEDDVALDQTDLNELHDNSGVSIIYFFFINFFIYILVNNPTKHKRSKDE